MEKKGFLIGSLIGVAATLAVQYGVKKYGAQVKKTWDEAVEKAKANLDAKKNGDNKNNNDNGNDKAGEEETKK